MQEAEHRTAGDRREAVGGAAVGAEEPVGRLGRRGRLAVLAVWTTLGLIESVKAYLTVRLGGRTIDVTTVLVGNLPWWLAWAAFTPAVLWIARRVRPEPGSRLRAVGVHAAASLALAALHHLVVGTLYYYTHTRGNLAPIGGELVPMTLGIQFRVFFASYFVLNLLTYWAVLGGYYALEFYARYRRGELRAARLEARMHRARLDALRMELNPHFLFNTLNAVSGLVRRRANEEAVQVLARLGELLRRTLERGSEPEVPLDRELELLGIYLDIVRVRYRDRLSVRVEVDEEAGRGLVPTLILQPLVENSVRHGIARRRGAGRITIQARQSNGSLELEVHDSAEAGANGGFGTVAGSGDGPAYDPGHDGEHESGNGAGIGLSNTRERLRELYGAAARLRFERTRHGARVLISIPYRDGEATDDDG